MQRFLLYAALVVTIITAATTVFAPSAKAAQFTGAYLLQVCEKDEKGREAPNASHATCQAYIAGVLDYHNVLSSLKLAPKIDVCIPRSVTLNQIHDIVLRYMRRHGEHDAFIASPIVTMALYEVYPCT